jgi:hypothetical protein
LFKALSPVWKAMVLDRIYEWIEWINTPKEILKIENRLTIYNEGTKDELYFTENLIEEDVKKINEEKRDNIRKKTKNFSWISVNKGKKDQRNLKKFIRKLPDIHLQSKRTKQCTREIR